MSSNSDSLYGISRPQRRPDNLVSSSTSSAFTSQLSSLLSESRDGQMTGAGRSKRGRDTLPRKEDIFTSRRRKKGADSGQVGDEMGQPHQTQDIIGGVDEDVLKRSKRKMEEKSRIYAAMKRGDYVDRKRNYVNDEDRGPLVDFDRKWAETEEGRGSDFNTSSDDDDNDEEDGDSGGNSNNQMIEYTDEYGRLRKGTKAQVARMQRQQRIQANATADLQELSARPSAPSNLIYGDTVQAAAFNPDTVLEKKMEELAARRDRSATPPEETHYDATKEVRSKGMGFYQFSKDSAQRQEEMESLGESRKLTEQWESERKKNREKKEAEMDESLRRERERKSEREANAFLKTLQSNVTSFVAATSDNADQPPVHKKRKKGW